MYYRFDRAFPKCFPSYRQPVIHLQRDGMNCFVEVEGAVF